MKQNRWAISLVLISGLCSLAATFLLLGWPHAVQAQAAAPAAVASPAQGWGLLGAAIAAGLSSLGAGIAVASVGSAAIGALAEKPELFGRVLILVGLAEGIAIYGLIVAVLIFNRLA